MDRRQAKKSENAPLRERTQKLKGEVDSLNRAISAELDWRVKLHPVEINDWDEDEAV